MEKLTIEQKAKAYDEALERAKKLYEQGTITESLSYVFPELKESEDVRMRKGIIALIEFGLEDGSAIAPGYKITKEEAIAWLEKQGEKEISELVGSEDKQNKIVDACLYGDKVEPKFHEGEWVVFIKTGSAYQVEKIENYEYTLRHIFGGSVCLSFSNEELIRGWTIEDAKEGDVLHSSSHRLIWIYKDNAHYHACIDMNYVTENIDIDGMIKIPSDVCPATSVQRAILFSNMEGAKYEWDAEKKELKEIEQEDEEYNGEDYGIDSLYHAIRILEKTLGEVEGYQSDDGILEHKCAITAVKKLYKKKPTEWSEEDVAYIDELTYFFEHCGELHQPQEKVVKWLKSLKQRIGG